MVYFLVSGHTHNPAWTEGIEGSNGGEKEGYTTRPHILPSPSSKMKHKSIYHLHACHCLTCSITYMYNYDLILAWQ